MKTDKLENIIDEDLKKTIERIIEDSASIKSFKYCDYSNKDFVMVIFNHNSDDEKKSIEEMIKNQMTFFFKEGTTRRGLRKFDRVDDIKAEKDFCKNYKI